ncbi:5-formyltetrahydrofolate cyclo-ligase [Magnetospirillum sp. UT-4]|uniref:5-formyltetrahydrofolate cyclo-ligase n=1 Tax=Magnetospirillum sp. UT-4 TaxID=2681467 RepID=UPI00137D018A|nr:5-formyltetrahydrofolate cyclo-ligase [Magnetospirillum sp. UT-4]CAA7615144.1 conserved hypothetical protein [Magnetospirillum sp. UT-4]
MTQPPEIRPTDIAAAKSLARARAVEVRRRAFVEAGPAAGLKLAAQAGALEVGHGRAVAGYWPMGDEIDPIPLMERLLGAGCRVALPVVTARGRPLDFRAWEPGQALEPGPHGTAHPPAAAQAVVPAVVLVPLLAFDRDGWRLGYGGGYYDRTLDLLRRNAQVRAIGVAFAAQRVAHVPRDGRDQRLDAVLTELGVVTPEAR